LGLVLGGMALQFYLRLVGNTPYRSNAILVGNSSSALDRQPSRADRYSSCCVQSWCSALWTSNGGAVMHVAARVHTVASDRFEQWSMLCGWDIPAGIIIHQIMVTVHTQPQQHILNGPFCVVMSTAGLLLLHAQWSLLA
jgi:hypothetical protein